MSYLSIKNLYAYQEILLFKECYALEKIDGTSAHISWDGHQMHFFSGGASNELFRKLFNEENLKETFLKNGLGVGRKVVVYGEAYGGKIQGMSATYGKDLKFVAFDVRIDDMWLSVDKADAFVQEIGLEFVYYERVSTDLVALDAQRDADSTQAVRNGIGTGKMREGVILRPLIELTKNNGERIICKHKRDEFRETATPRKVVDPAQLQVLADAENIADEWCTHQRLLHVLNKIPDHCMEKMGDIIKAMVEDVVREGAAEIVDSKDARKAIGKRAVTLYKDYCRSQLTNT
jgi:hypothetical protein